MRLFCLTKYRTIICKAFVSSTLQTKICASVKTFQKYILMLLRDFILYYLHYIKLSAESFLVANKRVFDFRFLFQFPGCWLLNIILFLILTDAYGCKIVSNSDTTYTCSPDNSSSQYKVHVLAVYEVTSRRPSTADKAKISIISGGKCNRPIVLVLVSYEPVNWILNIPSDITICKVILVSTKYSKHVS